MKIKCDMCRKEIEVQEWHAGECPHCGIGYYWEEMTLDDYSNEIVYIVFDK